MTDSDITAIAVTAITCAESVMDRLGASKFRRSPERVANALERNLGGNTLNEAMAAMRDVDSEIHAALLNLRASCAVGDRWDRDTRRKIPVVNEHRAERIWGEVQRRLGQFARQEKRQTLCSHAETKRLLREVAGILRELAERGKAK